MSSMPHLSGLVETGSVFQVGSLAHTRYNWSVECVCLEKCVGDEDLETSRWPVREKGMGQLQKALVKPFI